MFASIILFGRSWHHICCYLPILHCFKLRQGSWSTARQFSGDTWTWHYYSWFNIQKSYLFPYNSYSDATLMNWCSVVFESRIHPLSFEIPPQFSFGKQYLFYWIMLLAWCQDVSHSPATEWACDPKFSHTVPLESEC